MFPAKAGGFARSERDTSRNSGFASYAAPGKALRPWRRMGGRVVEGTGLENRQAGNRLVGSNPTPSASRRVVDTKRVNFHSRTRQPIPLVVPCLSASCLGRRRAGRARDGTISLRDSKEILARLPGRRRLVSDLTAESRQSCRIFDNCEG